MNITTEVIEKIRDSVVELLTQHKGGIGFAITDEGGVSIALPVKMVQEGEKLNVLVGINFVKDRIKDDIVFTVSDQQELFGPDGNPSLGVDDDGSLQPSGISPATKLHINA